MNVELGIKNGCDLQSLSEARRRAEFDVVLGYG